MEQNERTEDQETQQRGTTIKGTNYIWAIRPYRLDLPYEFALPHGNYTLDHWADLIGETPDDLRRLTEMLISNCHSTALLLTAARGRQPEVYLLGMDSLAIIYTVEPDVIVVRGYIRNLPDDRTDEVLAHSYNVDWDWNAPPHNT